MRPSDAPTDGPVVLTGPGGDFRREWPAGKAVNDSPDADSRKLRQRLVQEIRGNWPPARAVLTLQLAAGTITAADVLHFCGDARSAEHVCRLARKLES